MKILLCLFLGLPHLRSDVMILRTFFIPPSFKIPNILPTDIKIDYFCKMKIIKSLILYILIFCHSAVFSKTFIASDVVKIDSTTVKYFVKDFNNLTLGDLYSWDTTTLLASNFDKLDNPYKIYQTLSNSGFPPVPQTRLLLSTTWRLQQTAH